jgi:hypothetical protein
MTLDMLFFCFFWSAFGVDGHVVHIDCQPFFSDVISEYGIHHCLEGSRGVGESKEHYGWFK